jgi:hypothetical protein
VTAFLIVVVLLLVASGVAAISARRVPIGMIGLRTRHLPGPMAERYGRVAIGGAGPQADVLKGSQYYLRLPFLYDIKHVPQAYIPPDTIGLVVAKVGRVPSPGAARLAPFTECDHFQDGAAFLRKGGRQGLQMQVLTSGHYDINSHIFDVITIDNVDDHPTLGLTPDDLRITEITVGETGVVITHLGAARETDETSVAPRVFDHDHFQQPWAFQDNGGQLGVQAETLPAGGFYAINPWFARVIKIPTRNLVLEWSKDPKPESNFDAFLEQIELDVQGFTVQLDMKQTLRIPVEAAPLLVCRFGDDGHRPGQARQLSPVQQFVQKELAPTVTTYFRGIAAHQQILEFITKYDDLGMELSREVRDALAELGIVAVATSLGAYTCGQQDMNEMRRAIALARHRLAVLMAEFENSQIEVDIQKKRLEVDAARRELELVEIRGLVKLLGPAQVAIERISEKWATMGMPSTLVIGGANDDVAQKMLEALPFAQARDMLMAIAGDSGRQLGMAGGQDSIGSGQH